MITVTNVSVNFSGQPLFKDVDLKFTPGNCYGIIGANGAGKTTFLRVLSGDLDPSTGSVSYPSDMRMSVLKQDHFAFEEYTVLDTIIMEISSLYDIRKEKDALYAKEDFPTRTASALRTGGGIRGAGRLGGGIQRQQTDSGTGSLSGYPL